MGHGDGRGGWVRVAGIAAVILLLGALGIFVLVQVLSVQERNHDAIEVSCLIMSEKIVEAGGTATARTTEAGRAQAKLTGLYVKVITRDMTAAEIIEAAGYQETIRLAGGTISLPDCAAIAADPKGYLKKHRPAAR
jgi:hypothetical protein